jgi:hypothetical protein
MASCSCERCLDLGKIGNGNVFIHLDSTANSTARYDQFAKIALEDFHELLKPPIYGLGATKEAFADYCDLMSWDPPRFWFGKERPRTWTSRRQRDFEAWLKQIAWGPNESGNPRISPRPPSYPRHIPRHLQCWALDLADDKKATLVAALEKAFDPVADAAPIGRRATAPGWGRRRAWPASARVVDGSSANSEPDASHIEEASLEAESEPAETAPSDLPALLTDDESGSVALNRASALRCPIAFPERRPATAGMGRRSLTAACAPAFNWERESTVGGHNAPGEERARRASPSPRSRGSSYAARVLRPLRFPEARVSLPTNPLTWVIYSLYAVEHPTTD